MAQTIKHAKTSGVPDGGDTNQVQPSDWNADHAITGTINWAEIAGRPVAATTTEVLTGTGTTQFATPDAIAALWERGVNVAPAANTILGEGSYFYLTGSSGVSITDIDFAVPKDGRAAWIYSGVTATLVHSANLVCPLSTNIAVNAGDFFQIIQHSGDVVVVVNYLRANGQGVFDKASTTDVLTGTDANKTVTPDALAALWERVGNQAAADPLILGDGGVFFVNTAIGNINDIQFATPKDGRRALIYFSVTGNTLVHSATLYVPGATNYVIAAGDTIEIYQRLNDRRVIGITRLDGTPAVGRSSTSEVWAGVETKTIVTPDALAALWERGTDIVAAAGVLTLGEGGYFFIQAGAPGAVTNILFATPKGGRAAWITVNVAGMSLVPGANFLLPGAVTINCEQGDHFLVVAQSPTTSRVVAYTRYNVTPISENLRYRNRVINGAMQISQENGGLSGTTHLYYMADQWLSMFNLTGGVVTGNQVNSLAANFPRFRVRQMVTTAQASMGAGNYAMIQTQIEGSRIADWDWGLASAKPAVLRFTVHAPQAGTFAVALRDKGGTSATLSFVAPFTISAGEVGLHVEKTVLIPGPTSGTFLTDETAALGISFVLAAGSTHQTATINAWTAGSFIAPVGITNGMAAVNNQLGISRVGLYLDDGSGVAPPWEDPDPAEELRACQRYWQNFVFNSAVSRRYGAAGNTIADAGGKDYGVLLRTTPTLATIVAEILENCSAPFIGISGPQGAYLRVSITATGQYRAYGGNYAANARML